MISSTRRFLALTLGLLGHLNIVGAQAPSTEGGQAVVGIDSGWKYEDSLSVVPLHPKARTGLIDRVTEEGLISVAGPRFANEFYDESDNPGGLETRSFKCIVKCAAQVIELAPCIPVALATENPAALLKCLSLSQLCNCAECLPDAIENLIKSTICSSSSKLKSREEIDSNTTTAAPTALPPYAEYMAVTEDSVHHQAIRGELTHHRVAQIKTLNRFFAQPEGACVDAKAGCFIGSVCGSCGCCVGGCLNGTCIGACA